MIWKLNIKNWFLKLEPVCKDKSISDLTQMYYEHLKLPKDITVTQWLVALAEDKYPHMNEVRKNIKAIKYDKRN